MATERMDRISEEVKKELSNIIQNEIKDPRVTGIISVTKVVISKDLKYAKAYISVLGGIPEDTIKGLKSAAGFIRKEVSERVKLRATPEFSFELDNSIEYGVHISNLIRQVSTEQED